MSYEQSKKTWKSKRRKMRDRQRMKSCCIEWLPDSNLHPHLLPAPYPTHFMQLFTPKKITVLKYKTMKEAARALEGLGSEGRYLYISPMKYKEYWRSFEGVGTYKSVGNESGTNLYNEISSLSEVEEEKDCDGERILVDDLITHINKIKFLK